MVSPEPVPPAAAAKPSPQVLAAWRGKVLSHLNGYKQNRISAGTGTSTIAFSIDRKGRVLTANVVKSSGKQMLDKEAVALTQRASPLPPPPGEIAGDKLYLKVPIQFTR